MNQIEIDQKIIEHLPLVYREAKRFMNNKPSSVQEDDMIQVGSIGLIKAVKDYDAVSGASFKTYAIIRINGAMLDELRKNDWSSRKARRTEREIQKTKTKLLNKNQSIPTKYDIIEELGITLDDYTKAKQDKNLSSLESFDNHIDMNEGEEFIQSNCSEPNETHESDRFTEFLLEGISNLNKNDKTVLYMYYQYDMSQQDIADAFAISVDKISKQRIQIVNKLRSNVLEFTHT